LNLRGETPVDFESTALTTRPRCLVHRLLQRKKKGRWGWGWVAAQAYSILSPVGLRPFFFLSTMAWLSHSKNVK
jgi:hypothetical protein